MILVEPHDSSRPSAPAGSENDKLSTPLPRYLLTQSKRRLARNFTAHCRAKFDNNEKHDKREHNQRNEPG
jgi:hypothetical protein